MKLRTIQPRLRLINTSRLKAPVKHVDAYYLSTDWRALRTAALDRDQHRCAAEGCRSRAVVVDHILSRRDGGSDSLDNLRCLCRTHDNRLKERWDRSRRDIDQPST